MFNIERIAKEIGIDKKFLEPYGNYKAKIDLNILNDLNKKIESSFNKLQEVVTNEDKCREIVFTS